MLQTRRSRRWARAAEATLGIATASAVIAIAASAPLSHPTPVNAASAQAPSTALFLLLAGLGAVALAALVAVIWPGRRRKGDEEPELVPVPPEVHWMWKLLAIAFVFAVGATLVAAAVLGARTAHPVPFGGAAVGARSRIAPAGAGGGTGGFVLPSWVPWTGFGIVLAGVATGAALLVFGRARSVEEPPERRAARAAVDAAIDALDTTTDPRYAVIAAYAAMERVLAARGIRRLRAEAPREYLRRVLVAASGAERDAQTLTGLFEEARFSTHPISDRLRELALSALTSLHARLRPSASE